VSRVTSITARVISFSTSTGSGAAWPVDSAATCPVPRSIRSSIVFIATSTAFWVSVVRRASWSADTTTGSIFAISATTSENSSCFPSGIAAARRSGSAASGVNVTAPDFT